MLYIFNHITHIIPYSCLFGIPQIVGHSLGGGTASLLTYILREQKELSSSTCVTFAPGMIILILHLKFIELRSNTSCL